MNTEIAIEQFIRDEILFGDTKLQFGRDEDLVARGILDSLSLLRLLMFIEQSFGVHIEDGEVVVDNFQTINKIRTFVDARKKNGAA